MEININESLRCVCGGTINPITHKCEYCDTDYRNRFVRDISYTPYDVNVVKLNSKAQLPNLPQMSDEQRTDAVYKAIEAISLELAHKLLPYINWNTQLLYPPFQYDYCSSPTLLTGELSAHFMVDSHKNYQKVFNELTRGKSDFMP